MILMSMESFSGCQKHTEDCFWYSDVGSTVSYPISSAGILRHLLLVLFFGR